MSTSLFIVNDFPPILGGQSAYLYNLCRAFPKERIVVLAPRRKGCEDFDQKQTFTIIRRPYVFNIPIIEKIAKILLPLIYVLPILNKHNITMIHCAHVLSTGVVGLILKKLGRVKYCVYTYSADIMEYQKYGLIKKLMLSVLQHATKVVAISDYNREKLLELGVNTNKIIKIMPKIDIARFKNLPDPAGIIHQYDLKNKKVILSVNRLVKRKGNDMMLRAFAKIKNEIPNVVYVIVGSGEYETSLRQLTRELAVEKDVRFINSASHEDVLKFYAACDVLVMLSRELKDKGDAEGFGIVFLEANACGKPVVGGDSGGMRDAVVDGKTGLLVDPNDIDQIAQAVTKILTDTDYANQLAQAGKERAEQKFHWQSTTAEINESGLLDAS